MTRAVWKAHRFLVRLVVPMLFFSGLGWASSRADESLPPELRTIARAYEIEIISAAPRFPVETRHGAIDGKEADRKEIQNYTGLFVPEFSLYPVSLVRRTQLKRVVLCSHLAFAGQRRNAIPDFEHDTLYLDVNRGTYSKSYLRKVIHHEFFHIIDYRDDGSLYQDERWSALNPPEFQYGNGGQAVQDQRETSVLTTKFPGFLNHYSTTGVEEDKAEMFANLIVDPTYVEARADKDGVLHAKLKKMKALMASFCPEVNERFWEKAQTLRSGEK